MYVNEQTRSLLICVHVLYCFWRLVGVFVFVCACWVAFVQVIKIPTCSSPETDHTRGKDFEPGPCVLERAHTAVLQGDEPVSVPAALPTREQLFCAQSIGGNSFLFFLSFSMVLLFVNEDVYIACFPVIHR